MKNTATTVDAYLESIPENRKEVMQKLRNVITTNLPKGFEEGISYGMIGYYVPHSIYPNGYHCNPKLPLPFMSIASQKNSINLYHMGIYADKELYDWFVSVYKNHTNKKLDMGKSCIRFKHLDALPFELIQELCTKMTVAQWVDLYEKNLKK
ncbi:MAG TPA: DUF1801 domain-containing protein [Flavobacteriia bacterium]|jgi:uncharacterized protein YdhG (YjbR/CyaY superfamily)|nr:DUF1801 domain-containing protein [Flavobacteriia bacterium]